jgi:Na+:H+ antiporter, NhaC family
MAATGAPQEPGRIRDPSLADDIIPLVTLAVLISGSLALSGLDALNGPIQVG